MANRECMLNPPPPPPHQPPPKFYPESNWKYVYTVTYLGEGCKKYIYIEAESNIGGGISTISISTVVSVFYYDQQWNFLGKLWFRAVKGEDIWNP